MVLLATFAIGLVFIFSLDMLTKHGNSVKVPNVLGMRYDKAIEKIESAAACCAFCTGLLVLR